MMLRHLFPILRAPDGGAAAPAPAAPAASLLSDGQPPAGAPADPRAWLPEEYRADPVFKDYGDAAAVFKSHKHLAGMLGADRASLLKVPKDDTPEAWGEVWNRLGRPETPDGYQVQVDEALIPKDVVGAFLKEAHGAGLTGKQAQAALDVYTKLATAQQAAKGEAETASLTETVGKLRESWGMAYGQRVRAIETLVQQKMGPEGFGKVDALVKAGDIAMLNLLGEAAERMLEPGTLRGGSGGGMGGPMTPEAAKQEIQALHGDKDFSRKLMNRDDPGYPDAKRRWDELHRYAFP